jgi:hypothetical protein
MSAPEPQRPEAQFLPVKVPPEDAEVVDDENIVQRSAIIKDGDHFIACCAFCFEPKVRCVPISYDSIESFYRACDATPFALCCCDECFNSDRTELFLSFVDAVMILELARWLHKDDPDDPFWKRKGLINNSDDFYTFRRMAMKRGVFAREARRHSNLKHRRTLKTIMQHRDNNKFTPNLVFQGLLQKLYNDKLV